MKRKGFTLVELLAVIVILAIIAVIATPMILNVIDNAKKEAAEASASGYIDAIEKGILAEELKGNTVDKNKVYNVSEITFVNIKGNKPNDGRVIFMDGEIKAYSLKFDDYVINLEKEKVKTEKGDIKELTTCMALNIQDDDSYTYGDSYICDPGDRVYRIFYVLEDGDNTTLVKDDTGIAGPGEISLLMQKNLNGKNMAWASREDYIAAGGLESDYDAETTSAGVIKGKNDKGPVTALKYLEEQTSSWNKVSNVSLPTYNQVLQLVKSDSSYTGGFFPEKFSWLWDYGSNPNAEHQENTWGYWTSTTNNNSTNAYNVDASGRFWSYFVSLETYGVRPVITVSKGDIS